MKARQIIVLVAATTLGLVGCASHNPMPGNAQKIYVVDSQAQPTVVVVRGKSHPVRHCWKHRGHWHCKG